MSAAETQHQPAPGAAQAIVRDAIKLFSKKPKKLSPDEQKNLDECLIQAAWNGKMETVKTLLAADADVHAWSDLALRGASGNGRTDTVQALLAAGANVHVGDDSALCNAALNGCAETVQVLANHIFAPESWRGNSRAEIEAYAAALYSKIEIYGATPERLHEAGFILVDCALTCWEHVRPPAPGAAQTIVRDAMTDAKPKRLSPDEQAKLDGRLIDTASNGDTEEVRKLLADGADVHAVDDFALRWAVRQGHTETVKVLQEAITKRDAQRVNETLELERQRNPLLAGTGLTFAESRPEDIEALLREAMAEQDRPGGPADRDYVPLPSP
jgi:Ankyrin repeats (3 copies)